MNILKLKNIYIGLIAVLTALSAYLMAHQNFAPVLGQFGVGEVSKIASTTPTYFGVALGVQSSPRTATTTILTAGKVEQYKSIALGIQNTATNTATNLGTVYVQPQVSYDDSTWYNSNLPLLTSTGASLSQITLNNASSTAYLVFTPGELGTTNALFTFPSVVGKWIRFNVWTTGTSTVLLELFGLSQ